VLTDGRSVYYSTWKNFHRSRRSKAWQVPELASLI